MRARLSIMANLSECSSENDPFHDSDNSDDPDYEVQMKFKKNSKCNSALLKSIVGISDHDEQGNHFC